MENLSELYGWKRNFSCHFSFLQFSFTVSIIFVHMYDVPRFICISIHYTYVALVYGIFVFCGVKRKKTSHYLCCIQIVFDMFELMFFMLLSCIKRWIFFYMHMYLYRMWILQKKVLFYLTKFIIFKWCTYMWWVCVYLFIVSVEVHVYASSYMISPSLDKFRYVLNKMKMNSIQFHKENTFTKWTIFVTQVFV